MAFHKGCVVINQSSHAFQPRSVIIIIINTFSNQLKAD